MPRRQNNSKLNARHIDQLQRETGYPHNVVKITYYDSKKNVDLARKELGFGKKATYSFRNLFIGNVLSNEYVFKGVTAKMVNESFGIFDAMDQLQSLQDKYRQNGKYGISNYWIAHNFLLNEVSFLRTTAYLEEDKIRRDTIRCLHNSESDVSQIVRQRNISLDDLFNIPVEHLKFDLHWFTCMKALEYVKEIVEKMNSGSPHLYHRSVDIQLLTGVGNHSANSASIIRQALQKEYGLRIKVDGGNPGVLILTIPKKPTYSDAIWC
ncbi:hypothetical protein CRE_09063 [Caenorhabditis remanei]|uniref:Smr domain-containing protein n=1 Tax=Caenorhabditis remanei TaxID=31234 RepID=E3LJ52_CAERE|nr:hypothetical protein CRE_09063 [Caenorhabditis remanei]